jgi:transposase-like protein
MLFTKTTFTRRTTEMARKGQGIEIVAGWQEGLGGEDFLRDLVQRTVQQVLEAEMTSFLGAETYQRNDVRRGWRNVSSPARSRRGWGSWS